MSKKSIHIVQLYPNDMNIYGDEGNVLVLKRRLEWHGYEPTVTQYNVGDTFPKNVDIIIGGGGQDSGQLKIYKDLLKIGPTLHQLAQDGTPMLVVCGLYQLFGRFFQTSTHEKLDGIGILDIETYATNERLIGNVVSESETFGEIVGYENHSGQTTLGSDVKPLATIIKGAGNNSADGHEGARVHNVVGTYLHGSLLPKNPAVADWLIETAVKKRFGAFEPQVIDDVFADIARDIAKSRPR
jgi:lipid II isoglutaminyl synthase (glutamine-hydrolysing)